MADEARLLTPRFLLVVTCGLFYFLALGTVTPVIPHYVKDSLADGSIAVGATVTAFAAGAIVLRTLAGRLGDRAGRRVLIIGGAALVAVSIAGYGLVHALWWLIAMRVVSGFGEAGFFVGAATMITDLAPPARRGAAVSYWSVAVYGGISIGPALGELLRTSIGFGVVWTVAASFAAVATLLGLCTVEVPRSSAAPRATHLFHRAAVLPGAVLFLGLIALAGFNAFMPLYAGTTGVSDGLVFALYGVLILVVRIAGAHLPDRLGGRRGGALALAVTAVGIGVVAVSPSAVALVLGTIVFAAGMSLMYPALLLLALTGVPDVERASAVGTFSSFFDASQGLGALICGAVVAVTGNRGAFAAGAIGALLGLAILLRRVRPAAAIATDAASTAVPVAGS